MTPVPPRGTGKGSRPTHAYGEVKRDKPLKLVLRAKSGEDLDRRIQYIRVQACKYGIRHDMPLVVRLMSRSPSGLTAKVEVHWDDSLRRGK